MNVIKVLNNKKVIGIIFICILLLIFGSSVNGQITPSITESTHWTNVGSSWSKTILTALAGLSLGPLTIALTTLINVILVIIFIILSFVFSPVSPGLFIPLPDQIVFNQIGFFDPNFMNPPTYSVGSDDNWSNGSKQVPGAPVVVFQNVISQAYGTSFVVAASVFSISAMVIGIKLAITTIASEKAHYKEALNMWITCIAMLIFVHVFIYLVFTLNEMLVEVFSNAAAEVPIVIDVIALAPIGGQALSDLLSFVTFGVSETLTQFTVYGYGGLMLKFLMQAIAGDMISSIICGVMIGQTCSLIIQYLKRLFYCILLAVIAPLIIAADVMKKSIGI